MIGKRVFEIRMDNHLTIEDFASRIQVSSAYVWMIENGTRVPSARLVSSICREFNVSEAWLRTGEGEMHLPKSRREEIEEVVRRIMEAEPESFKARFIEVMASLTEMEWEALENILSRFSSAPAQKAESQNDEEWSEARAHAELQRQIDEEKSTGGKASLYGSGNSGTV